MLHVAGTGAWQAAHPQAVIGLLELSGVVNTDPDNRLDQVKRQTEARLRQRYAGFTRPDFLALPVMAAYDQYYRRFNKTYHVQLQLESIVLKGKSLPNVSPLVDANFTAEVETLVLTAGHDAARLVEPVCIDVSLEGDTIIQMNGETRPIRPGDMVMRDAQAVSCSILYGQDQRSPISSATAHVLYVTYAPPGVPAESVDAQLGKILEHVRLFSPQARLEQRRLLAA